MQTGKPKINVNKQEGPKEPLTPNSALTIIPEHSTASPKKSKISSKKSISHDSDKLDENN